MVDWTRREFWQGLTAMTAALAVPSVGGAADGERDKFGPLLPKRKLGNDGPAVTMRGPTRTPCAISSRQRRCWGRPFMLRTVVTP